MEASRAVIILVCVSGYLLVCIGIGLWALRRTRSTHDFFMAGRELGVVLTGFAVFSSTMSGFGFVGGPGLVYSMGVSSIWIIATTVVGGAVAFTMVAKRLRLIAELRDSVSLPDVVAARYGSQSVRGSVAVVVILGVLGYLATQILAMAIVLRQVLQDAGLWESMSLLSAVAISTAILVFYTVTGGIIATVYTDFVQGIIMIVAAVLVFVTAVGTFDGGLTEITAVIAKDDPGAMGAWGTLGMFGALSWFLVFGLGLAGQPHVITKYMMLKRVRDIRRVVPLSAFAYGITALLWIGIGLAMRALVLDGVHAPLVTPDAAAADFLQTYAHPVLAGIVFAALLAAIMSTADGFLNIGTAAIIHDIPNALRGRSLGRELLWARVTTVLLAAAAAIFALYSGDLVALLGAFGWGTFAAALVPVVVIGLNWKRATAAAANVAILSSVAINFGMKLSGVSLPGALDLGAVSLVVSLFLFLTISFFSQPPELDPDIEAVMAL